ncbi:MAG TPA: XRE family transcriptional regulator, partial [Candidatus Syntrophosphaera sp.]|nr:XRE family transcriptional regulator [Candidatus Syntrophosphaera sp.]
IGRRMMALRLTLKVTQSALAKTLKVKPSAISQIESGKIRPSTDTMLLLTKLCDVNLHWLITGKGPMWVDPQDSRQKTREKLNQVRDFIHSELDVLARSREQARWADLLDIPVSGEIAAGPPVDNFDTYMEFLTIRRAMIRGVVDDYVCLRVNGCSMEPTVLNNDLVLIRQSQDWRQLAGQICALRIDGGITLKRLMMDDKEKMIILVSLNDEYQPLLINPDEHQDITLIGSLYYLMRKVS